MSFSRYYSKSILTVLFMTKYNLINHSAMSTLIYIFIFSFIFKINRKWNITWKWEEKLSQLVFLEVYIFISLCINLDDVRMSSRWRWKLHSLCLGNYIRVCTASRCTFSITPHRSAQISIVFKDTQKISSY